MKKQKEDLSNVLDHIFYVEKPRPNPKTHYTFNGRVAIIQKCYRAGWEGWWQDDHSMTYEGPTKRYVKQWMEGEASQ